MSTMTREQIIRAVKNGADLRGVDLRGTNLSGTDLRGANLREADLRGVDLSGADLHGADLREANLNGADLYGANLSWMNLSGADLSGTNLIGANLRGVRGGILVVEGLHPYRAILIPTVDGWYLIIGCWRGTISALRTLIAGDYWPEAKGEQITQRRPLLASLADMCDAHAAAHTADLAAVVERWGTKEVTA